jgi:simple sugar transport system ATP-binding protein
VGIIVISDELAEVFHNCSRVIVMHKGRFTAEFDTAQTTQDEIRDFIAQSN